MVLLAPQMGASFLNLSLEDEDENGDDDDDDDDEMLQAEATLVESMKISLLIPSSPTHTIKYHLLSPFPRNVLSANSRRARIGSSSNNNYYYSNSSSSSSCL